MSEGQEDGHEMNGTNRDLEDKAYEKQKDNYRNLINNSNILMLLIDRFKIF